MKTLSIGIIMQIIKFDGFQEDSFENEKNGRKIRVSHDRYLGVHFPQVLAMMSEKLDWTQKKDRKIAGTNVQPLFL